MEAKQMTRDEILEMKPGREMDKLIAEKIFGLDVRVMTTTRHGKDGPDFVFHEYFVYQEGWVGGPLVRRYSTDMTAAWKVARKEGIAVLPQSSDNGYRWFACDIESVAYRGSEIALRKRNDSGISCDTAAEAICKAAMLADI